MLLTLFMALTAGAYAWYIHNPYLGVAIALAMVTIVPKLLWAVVRWRMDRLPGEVTKETILSEMRVAGRLSWLTWIGILIAIAMTGSQF